MAVASRAEEAEGDAPKPVGARVDERNKRRLQKKGGDDHFGANFGEQFAGRKGAQGDVMKEGSVQPYAYLPLNPRLLGKKQQRAAKATLGRLAAPMKRAKGAIGRHGLQARRGRRSDKK